VKILITGGTGFVGRHLLEALNGRHRVAVLVRDEAKLRQAPFPERISVIHGDLFASQPFPEDLDLVFHLAAVTKALSSGEFMQVNHQGTLALLERLKRLRGKPKVVLLSSLAAAGPSPGNRPLSEKAAARPVSLYGWSKLRQEEAVMANGRLPYLIIRAPIVFGPGDMDLLDIFKMVKRGLSPEMGREKRWYSIIYVKDLARGLAALGHSRLANETFYLANPEPVLWDELIDTAARLLDVTSLRRVRVPRALVRSLAEISQWRGRLFKQRVIFNRDKFREINCPAWTCSPEKVRRRLQLPPFAALEESLAATLDWYQDNRLL